ncbi:MAG: hypothetical protein K8R25_15850 [Methanosarcinales archaeon]|nr:hypothetical protein [Methanosarcinales archaeon]
MKNKGIKFGSVLVVMMLMGMAFVPAVSAKAEKSRYDALLKPCGITIKEFETTITEKNKIGDKFVFSGNFNFDVEKKIDGQLKSQKSKGTINGVIESDGSIHTKYSGDDFKLKYDLVKINESNEKIKYQFSEVITHEGKTTRIDETIEVPKQDAKAISNLDTNIDKSTPVNALLTKYDIPSTAPPNSIKVWNDLQYSDLIVDLALLATIAVFFNIAVAKILAMITALVVAIPEWLDFDPDNVYFDIYCYGPNPNIHMEIDYIYY